jgi:hypothetical protein
MRNADELYELDEQSWVTPSHRRLTGSGPGRGRIRYAFGGAPPPTGQPRAAAPPGTASVTAPRADLWVLVCGGIAAAAAFTAAFVASGGVAAHAATPQTAVHSVVIQACPAATPGR